jgi:lipid A 3-O-deacylase
MSMKKYCLGMLVFTAFAATVQAGQLVYAADSKKEVVVDEFPYTKGTVEVEINGGAFGSIGTHGTAKRPDTGYAIAELRVGCMLTTASGDGFFRGNLELIGEVFGGPIFHGPGDGLVGVDIFLRYNFVQPDSRIVPFIQIGGGGVYSDAADDDLIQRNIGSDFSFNLVAEIGVRYHLSRNLAITTGVEYRHISNASLADRNQGLNSLGGVIGVSMFF